MNMRRHLALASATAVLGGGLAIAPAASAGAVTARADAPAKEYSCSKIWYSGTALTVRGHTGKRVIEVQCLLKLSQQTGKFWKNHGYKVDGIFGPNTERAVKYHQSKAHILVDGKVGKQTWKTLRTYKY
ncbi:peptidoglycan-binding protein [Streptomyces luteolifulvus]|uniref:Peptidoglycan-binding protein n=1 Tax=Streptomyces luteolifulvus TaxID=2615112 RepID=A0A6H9UQW7_9ACTN|nr:peptidoglycan-binding protein [Streptomyces luteolifulvus]KAB1140670.1 peptidoglycan-binding protein [Streptomyces luteolifulvus]